MVLIDRSIYGPKTKYEKGIALQLTDWCNLECHYCYPGAPLREMQLLSLKDITNIIKDGRELGFEAIQLKGGEPMLYPNLAATLRLCLDESFKYIEISSNLTVVPRSIKQMVRDYNVRISTPLYSYCPSIHGSIVGDLDAWDNTVRNIEEFLAVNACIKVYVVELDNSPDNTTETENFLKDIGVNDVEIVTREKFEKVPFRTTLHIYSNGVVSPDRTLKGYRPGNISSGRLKNIVLG